MKREVSPVTAVIIIVVVLLVIGGVYWWMTEGRMKAGGGAEPPPMPPDVQAEFQRRLGGITPGAAAPGGTQGAPAPAPAGR
ncbi:MAG: hypothetical protein K6U75_04505 [Firmicutes bacterium]|nr:hypothetical protein [Bacillota bacterium]